MPTPPKTLENIKKHLTLAEREARQAAEGEVTRHYRPQLRCPKWLDDDARQIFEETKKRLKGLQLLDSADAELLAIYSDTVAKYQLANEILAGVDEDGIPMNADKDEISVAQGWARIIKTYAAELGLTPTARARLAKRKAEKQAPDELEELLDNPEKW